MSQGTLAVDQRCSGRDNSHHLPIPFIFSKQLLPPQLLKPCLHELKSAFWIAQHHRRNIRLKDIPHRFCPQFAPPRAKSPEVPRQLSTFIEAVCKCIFREGFVLDKELAFLAHTARRQGRKSGIDEARGDELDVGITEEFEAFVRCGVRVVEGCMCEGGSFERGREDRW